MTNRFDVKVPTRGSAYSTTTEDVGADRMYVGESGALIFTNDTIVKVAYAPGEWLFAEAQE